MDLGTPVNGVPIAVSIRALLIAMSGPSTQADTAAYALNERAQHLLKVLVERYIRDGQPVGSRALSRDSGLSLSPATIRNVMADLEDCGLLASPHTSAGRVPTASGYRVFVDTLLSVQPLQAGEVHHLEVAIDPEHDTETLVRTASTMLSSLTHLTGVVMIPRHEGTTLRQVEFLPLSDRRVLVILVVNEREVQNRIISVHRDYTASELEQAGNYLTRNFAGLSLEQVREALIRQLREDEGRLTRLLPMALDLSGKAFADEAPPEDYVVAGQTNLMDFDELADLKKLRETFEALAQKRELLSLMDRCLDAEGLQIFIGEESGYDVLGELSVVTTPYAKDGQVIGVLGVIGPTRMPYERVISIVDVTARLLGSALNSRR